MSISRAELQYLLRRRTAWECGLGWSAACRSSTACSCRTRRRFPPERLIERGYLKHPFRVMLPEMPEQVRWETRKRSSGKPTALALPGWRMRGSDSHPTRRLRRVFPSLPEKWDTLSFDQHWRLTQLAVNERCATREGIDDLIKDAGLDRGRTCR